MWNKLNKKNNSAIQNVLFKELENSTYFEQVLKIVSTNFEWDNILYSYWDSSTLEQPIFYKSSIFTSEYYLLWDDNSRVNDKDILIKLFCLMLLDDFKYGGGAFKKYALTTGHIFSYILLRDNKFANYISKIFNNIENLMKLNQNLSFMKFVEEFEGASTLEEAANNLYQLLSYYESVTGNSIISENLLNSLINSIEVYHVANDYIQRSIKRYIHIQDLSEDIGTVNCERIVFNYVI